MYLTTGGAGIKNNTQNRKFLVSRCMSAYGMIHAGGKAGNNNDAISVSASTIYTDDAS